MEEFLVGVCGMSRKEAAMTSMEEYELKVRGYRFARRTDWEIARWMEWHQSLISPTGKPGTKPNSPKDLMRFDWEEKEAVEDMPEVEDCHISKEGQDALTELMKRTFKL